MIQIRYPAQPGQRLQESILEDSSSGLAKVIETGTRETAVTLKSESAMWIAVAMAVISVPAAAKSLYELACQVKDRYDKKRSPKSSWDSGVIKLVTLTIETVRYDITEMTQDEIEELLR